MSYLGKNMRKYAEISYQRLGTMASRVSDEEFAVFVNLIAEVCENAQVWIDDL